MDLEHCEIPYLYIEFHSVGFQYFPKMDWVRQRLGDRYAVDFEHVTTYTKMNLFVYEVMFRRVA